jgi:hypothetical protein
MNNLNKGFAQDLELFRTEVEGAIQCFYAWDAIHTVAASDKQVFLLLNEAPLFWNTSLGALQTSTFVALGRIFDTDARSHSVSKLLATAHRNLFIFSKTALAERKRAQSSNADEWLPKYLESVYEPTNEDFRRLKSYVAKRRKIYEKNYQPLRHKVFAHREISNQAEVIELFSNTNIRELQQLLIFLRKLYEALWQLYFNGRKPLLGSARFSVQRMLDLPSSIPGRATLQERLVRETKDFLVVHSKHIARK